MTDTLELERRLFTHAECENGHSADLAWDAATALAEQRERIAVLESLLSAKSLVTAMYPTAHERKCYEGVYVCDGNDTALSGGHSDSDSAWQEAARAALGARK